MKPYRERLEGTRRGLAEKINYFESSWGIPGSREIRRINEMRLVEAKLAALPSPLPHDLPTSVDLVLDVPVVLYDDGQPIEETPRQAIDAGAGYRCTNPECMGALTALEIVMRDRLCGHCADKAADALAEYGEEVWPEEIAI
jgi:hypothetical protein